MAELGRGAFGYVFLAYDEKLGCPVALKVLRPELAADPHARGRFEAEARRAAGVRHDHVITIHHVGSTPGFALPYFVMEYLDGGSLADRLERDKALAPREAAEVARQVASGLAGAHARGLVHRDIKPSNILLEGGAGRAKITDFGLARELDADRTRVTQPGMILGTPSYMSPEQVVAPEQAGPRSDVYSLGAVLYELLTGQPPFRGASHRVLQQVVHDEPPPPRKLDDRIPRDLETICLKCLEKDPRKRYAGAAELTGRLRLFLDGRPIPDRPLGKPERLWRWCRRHPAVAAWAGSVALLLLVIAVGSSLLANRARRERDTAQGNLERALKAEGEKGQLWDSYLAQARAARQGNQAGQRFKSLEALARVARQRPSLELRNEAVAFLTLADLREVRERSYAATPEWSAAWAVAPGLKHYASSDEQGTLTVRRVGDNQVIARCSGDGVPAFGLQFSPDGQLLAAKYNPRGAPGPNRIRVWQMGRPEPVLTVPVDVVEAGSVSPDNSRLAVGGQDGWLYLYDVPGGPGGKRLAWVSVSGVPAFHPSGRELAVFSRSTLEVQVLDADTGRVLHRLSCPARVQSLAWHPEGKRLAAACDVDANDEFPIYVWDTASWREPLVLRGHTSEVRAVAFSHGGDLLASVGWDGSARLWDPWTGRHLVRADGGGDGVQFSPDDRALGVVGGGGFVFREVATGRECRALYGHTGYKGPWYVDFSPDGRLLASAGNDGVRLWDVATARGVGILPPGQAESARFRNTDRSLIASGGAGVYHWPIVPDPEDPSRGLRIGPPRPLLAGWHYDVGFGPDGRALAVADTRRGRVMLLDLAGPAGPTALGHEGARCVAIDPAGRWVAAGSSAAGKGVRVWDLKTRELVKELGSDNACLAFSPDGHWLVTSTRDEYHFWVAGSWEPGHTISSVRGLSNPLAFTPDGSLLAITSNYRSVRLVDPATGGEFATLTAPEPQGISWLCFSPDGTRLAAATAAHVVHLWDLRRIRQQLAGMNLDWDLPAYPPAEEEESSKPLAVKVLPGE
jgi:WD40 repeat protein